ncbi:Uncharacterised protein [Salmonella enterica subsp. enterica]|nr:Uncharacterised protein [Salmonella enterica subsp. enterica]
MPSFFELPGGADTSRLRRVDQNARFINTLLLVEIHQMARFLDTFFLSNDNRASTSVETRREYFSVFPRQIDRQFIAGCCNLLFLRTAVFFSPGNRILIK